MGHWNYRYCKETVREYDDEPVIYYSIREVLYDGDDDSTIWGVTENAVGVGVDHYASFDTFDPIETARETLEKMMKALAQPVLDLDTIVYADRSETDEDT